MLKIGTKAPPFSLNNQYEKNVSITSFDNKKLIIFFYPKANTPGWTIEAQGFRDEFNTFNQNNIEIIGVSADKVSLQKSFAEKHQLKFNLLSDTEHNMIKLYQAWGLKKFMGREYEGIFRYTYVVDANRMIELAYDKVKTKTHAQDIINDLNL